MSTKTLPLHETTREHVGNALQILCTFAFLNGQERAGKAGLNLVYDVSKRLTKALAQLDEAQVCARCGQPHVGKGRTSADAYCGECRFVEEP